VRRVAPTQPTRMQRVVYPLLCTAFGLAPLAGPWLATTVSTARPLGVALLITAGIWVLLVVVTVTVASARGRERFEAFKSSVEQQSHTSFRSLLLWWIVAIAAAVIYAVQQLHS
jgi:hypothetical protein